MKHPKLSNTEASNILEQTPSTTSQSPEMQYQEAGATMTFDELLKAFGSRHEGKEMPKNLSGGVLLDRVYAAAPSALNAHLFSPSSDFLQSLAEIQGTTGLEIQVWRLENDGEILKRVISYTKAPTKLVKAVKATEEITYLKADGKMFAVLANVSTPDVPLGNYYRVEVLTCIMPGPELPDDEQSSRLVVSWRVNFLQSTMMRGMIENGTRQGLKYHYVQFSELLVTMNFSVILEFAQDEERVSSPQFLYESMVKLYDGESSSRVSSPQSCKGYIRIVQEYLDGRNEQSSSKKNSSLFRMDGIKGSPGVVVEPYLFRMDGMYISQLKALEQIIDRREPPSNLSLAVLQLITKNFSDELIIGRGGCGVVYKGILTNGIIAVKKLLNSHTVDDKMFHQEVQSMMMVNHQNTVRFLGYCSHTEEKAMKLEGTVIMAQIRERMLCFEYIGNGSLESHLTDELRGLEWHVRYQIIQGICEGLQHLHKEKHIIHMDLKPANILIDDCMVPKITDFGLSRLDDKSQTMSAQRLLSLGYCAPEYLHHGKRSAKSDIYSLGVIILELVTGSKQIPCTTKVLRRWNHRWNKLTKEDIQLGYKQVAKCLNLARRCIQTDPVNRPNIWDIISDLNKTDNCSDEHISDSTEFLELEDMLGIEPLEIHLPFELNKQVSCSVELTNDTDNYFAFRISTTSLRPYCINTNKDILPPRSKCSVTITLQALEKEPPWNQRRDEFSVQSTKVDGSLAPTDITGELFAEHSGKVVDDVNLVVVLDGPQPLPGDAGD